MIPPLGSLGSGNCVYESFVDEGVPVAPLVIICDPRGRLACDALRRIVRRW
jgi:hypothetical protein